MTTPKQPGPAGGDEINQPNLVTGTVELVVTAEMRAAIERKRLKRQNAPALGRELRASERGEVDLGDLDE